MIFASIFEYLKDYNSDSGGKYEKNIIHLMLWQELCLPFW